MPPAIWAAALPIHQPALPIPFPHGELHLPGGLLARRSYKLLFADRGCRQGPRKGPEGEEKELELEQELKVPGDNYLPFASGKGRRGVAEN